MTPSGLLTLLFLFLSGATNWAAASAATAPADAPKPVYYPWDEASPTFRLHKSLLPELNLWSMTMTNAATRTFVLTPDFIAICGLQPDQVAAVQKAMDDALHEYRIEFGKRLTPTEQDVTPPAGLRGLQRPEAKAPGLFEEHRFQLTPFPKETEEITSRLRTRIEQLLGPARSGFFWEASNMLPGEMSAYQSTSSSPDSANSQTIYRFKLNTASPVTVDFYASTRRDGPEGAGGGSMGWTWGEPLDVYAPESFKPVLARWRKLIAEHASELPADHPSPYVITQPPEVQQGFAHPPGVVPWDEQSPFVHVPKRLLKAGEIMVLTRDERLSTEVRALLGIDDALVNKVDALYQRMQTRVELIEREHFRRERPNGNAFVLAAFPEEMEKVLEQWKAGLTKILGAERTSVIEDSLQRWANDPFAHLHHTPKRGALNQHWRPFESDRSWRSRGRNETKLDATLGLGEDGRPTIDLRWRRHNGPGGTFRGPVENMPPRWRHLLTPDVLGQKLVL